MHYFMILPRNRTGTYPTEFCPHFSLKQRERKWFNQTLVCPKPITAPENELLSASPLQAERRNLVILIEAWSPRLWWPQKRGFSRKKKHRHLRKLLRETALRRRVGVKRKENTVWENVNTGFLIVKWKCSDWLGSGQEAGLALVAYSVKSCVWISLDEYLRGVWKWYHVIITLQQLTIISFIRHGRIPWTTPGFDAFTRQQTAHGLKRIAHVSTLSR